MKLRLLAIGAITLLGQTVILRELAVAFYGTELIYAVALGVAMFATAAGAWTGARRSRDSESGLSVRLAAYGLALIAAIVTARGMRVAAGGVTGAYLPLGRQVLGLVACVVPVSAIGGALFRRAARMWVKDGGTFAGAYAWESAGAMLGGLLATGLLAAGVSNLLAGLIAAGGAVVALGSRTGGALAAALVLGGFAWGPRLDRATTAWTHPTVVDTRDTPYGRVTVTEQAGQLVVFHNDALAYESESTSAEEFVSLALIQRDGPLRIAMLGGVVPGLAEELARFGPASIAAFELDRGAVEAAGRGAGGVVFGDPRQLLERSAESFDVILVAMPEPDSGGANRFYTREFFEVCARRLGGRGVLALRLRGSENLWTPLAAARAASIERALRAEFADVVALPGTTQLFLASAAPLDRDPEMFAARLRDRGAGARLVTPAYVRYRYTNDRVAEAAAVLAETSAPVNRDGRPVCYAATMGLWLSRFVPQLGSARLPVWEAGPWIWGALALAVTAAVLARRGAGLRRALLAGLAGCAGMILECAVLLDYQTRSGVLYRDLGILMTAFMAGLALGAAAVERSGSSAGLRAATAAAFAVLALATAGWFSLGSPGGLLATSIVLVAGGLGVAALVAHAALAGRGDAASVVAPVYAADLIGGGLGSLAAGLALIPFAGLPATMAIAAVVVAIAALA